MMAPYIPFFIVLAVLLLVVIAIMWWDNRSTTVRIVHTASSLPEPDACETVCLRYEAAESDYEELRERILDQVGADGRCEIMALRMLDGRMYLYAIGFRASLKDTCSRIAHESPDHTSAREGGLIEEPSHELTTSETSPFPVESGGASLPRAGAGQSAESGERKAP